MNNFMCMITDIPSGLNRTLPYIYGSYFCRVIMKIRVIIIVRHSQMFRINLP